MLKHICVIRHARCRVIRNEEHRLVDDDLDDSGLQHSEIIATHINRIREGRSVMILTSDAKRAELTAAIVAGQLASARRTLHMLNGNTSGFFGLLDSLICLRDLITLDLVALITHRAFIDGAIHYAGNTLAYACSFDEVPEIGYGSILTLDLDARSMNLIPMPDSFQR